MTTRSSSSLATRLVLFVGPALIVTAGLCGCAARSGASGEDRMSGVGADRGTPAETAAAVAVLRDFHDAASKADSARYFGHLAPGAVFIGTDDTERWSREEFFAYAQPYFSKGKGWTYEPHHCNVSFSGDGRTAWFDEKLDNEKYGRCRGSGVLSLRDGVWKIEQYVLSVPIPNELMPEVAARIRAGK
jgi:hypothetical protein